MGLILDYTDGQTPLEEEEKEGLLIPGINTRRELDEFEQQNIEQAILWTMGKRFKMESILTEAFIRNIHKRMYGDVWAWAGEFRKTNKNLGVDKWQISTQLKILLDDAEYWYQNKTFSPDEFAMRFSHKLVSIHCFTNGNGRHSRLMADIIIDKIFYQPVYSWGAGKIVKESDQRSRYLKAMREADKGNMEMLIEFARS